MDDDEGMGLAMTADNADGIDEDLTRAVGMAMIAASRAGEQLARMKQAADRERQARATGNAQRAERELAAHTEAARAYFEVVTRPEYLHTATDAQIRGVTQQAEGWRERLPEGQRAVDGDAAGQQVPQPQQVETARVEQQAVATAEVAQARSAWEAPAAGRGRTEGRGSRSVPRVGGQTGMER